MLCPLPGHAVKRMCAPLLIGSPTKLTAEPGMSVMRLAY
jgi:hypothetical protein